MTGFVKYRFILLCFFLTLSAGSALAHIPALMKEDDVLPYLEKMIAWRRVALSPELATGLPREQLLKNSLQQHANDVLNGSFTFAHAVAGTLEGSAHPASSLQPKTPVPGQGLRKTMQSVEQEIQKLQSGLAQAKRKAQRDKLAGMLKLAEEHLSLLKTIAENIGSQGEKDDSLEQKINELSGTIPEFGGEQQKNPASGTMDEPAAPQQSGGIWGLITEVYGGIQTDNAVESLMAETKNMRDDSRKNSLMIRDAIKDILRQGDNLGLATTSARTAPTYDDLVSDMQKLSKIAVAANGIGRALDACTRDLTEWDTLVSDYISEQGQHLFFRLGMLLLTVFGACGVSMLAGRAIQRYVPDDRRRNQLRTIQKIVLTVVIGIIVFLGFFTDFSSLATFMGLLSAGLAVALQNVLLSSIAYFHFFGTYGLRTGDRITISGVTGKVMKISMLRFYLMELEKSDLGYLPTGRIVSFTNSILFQPTPFFRQTPGTNFVWSEISLTLDQTIDHNEAYKKLYDVVQRVYTKHRAVIKRQEETLRKLSHFKTEVSVPQVYLKITGHGLILTIRYAVEREQESALHLQLTEELLATIKKDPELKIVNIG